MWFFSVCPVDVAIKWHCDGEFILNTVVAMSPDPRRSLAMFLHNSQLTQTSRSPQRPVWIHFTLRHQTRALDLSPVSWSQWKQGHRQRGTQGEGLPEHTSGARGCYGYGCGNYSALVIAHTATPAPKYTTTAPPGNNCLQQPSRHRRITLRFVGFNLQNALFLSTDCIFKLLPQLYIKSFTNLSSIYYKRFSLLSFFKNPMSFFCICVLKPLP